MTFETQISNPEQITERLITRAYAMVADAERMISEQRQRIRQLENLSFCDGLTGLLNRRGFEGALTRELASAGRDAAQGGVVILVDLDGFKGINDTFGHAAGDAYLKAIAAFLQDNCRPSDMVARLGGDEFAIIMPRTKSATGQRRATTLLAKLNTAHMEWEGHALRLRASFGAAGYSGHATVGDVLERADRRLYSQKGKRREKLSAAS